MGTMPHGLKRLVTTDEKLNIRTKGQRFGSYTGKIKPIEKTLTFGYVGLVTPFHEPKKVGKGLGLLLKRSEVTNHKRWRFSEMKWKKIRPVPCGTFSFLEF
ncbi:hypothetical protein [Bacillus sp. CDB3]|uniref:hypothetical protein n=1 Tax=Bacillus sp. CDB3 TaxID=360310 RepID=UPI0009D7D871|nr:hypothetical protein [Bacillus sp. CDB3]OQR53278.1 hypothetical protein CDB3_31010 [Bacillus sp. CDB3]